MKLYQIIEKVHMSRVDQEAGCLTLRQERQLVEKIEEQSAVLEKIAKRYPCVTASEMQEVAQGAM